MPPQGDWWQYMPWFGMFMGTVTMVLFIVIAFLVIVPLMRAMGMGPPTWHGHYPPYPPQKTALDILNERFARGEINKEGDHLPRMKIRTGARLPHCLVVN